MKKVLAIFGVLLLSVGSLFILSAFSTKINYHHPMVATPGLLQDSHPILFTQENINNFKKHHESVDALLKKLNGKMDYQPSPMKVMELAPHYTSTGTNDNEKAKLFQNDSRMAYSFALGYAVSNIAAFARKAQDIIDAWSKTLEKVTTKQSEDEINFNVPYLVIGASLVRNEGNWDTKSFSSFLQNIALPAIAQANINNHGLWGIFMESTIYAWLGDKQGMTKIRKRWMEHLQHSINDSGVMPNEIQRSGTTNWHGGPDKGIKGLPYTHFALLPATLAAVVF